MPGTRSPPDWSSALVGPTERSSSPASAGSEPGWRQTALPRRTTLVVRMCSIARRRLPAVGLTSVPYGERTRAATAPQTQQELSQPARATARRPAPGSVHRAGAAGQRRLLETLPQARQWARRRGRARRCLGQGRAASGSSGAAADPTAPPACGGLTNSDRRRSSSGQPVQRTRKGVWGCTEWTLVWREFGE